ncbi:MAG: S-methyl-5-thioribose-1-phosphate isomerase [Candidatus Omnitrophica bacterium]|nr:S-methyl-5-thioribose-1-phosphate isomerase [Candidatus Omnitrophota bacterium]
MEGAAVCLLDQRALPHKTVILRLARYEETVGAIRQMAVRGAVAIGMTGGYAMAQAALTAPENRFWEVVERARAAIGSARPTAKNLTYAVERVHAALKKAPDVPAARRLALLEAQALYRDDARMTRRIAEVGLPLLPKKKAVLTHCNAGWLACPNWGTALAPIYLAHRKGKSVFVYATETRPRGQGAKLTTWELAQEGVSHALLADTAVGHTMAQGEIGLVIVGADRIAANGDTANKIGTYGLAVLARAHRIPFYVAAPSPTFDAECPSGREIPMEERSGEEVLQVSGLNTKGEETSVRVATAGVTTRNPAFDVTPARLIAGFVTERGIVRPTKAAIRRFLNQARRRSTTPPA